jgi:uncharacterized protein
MIRNKIRKLKEKRAIYIKEFHKVVGDLLSEDKVQEMKLYNHHGNCDCYKHCLHVAYFNYIICDIRGLDKKKAARAGLMHDLFLYDWHTCARETGNHFHGITHSVVALKHAENICELSDKEKNIIESHMWPLTLHLIPRSREAYLTTFTDKICGFYEKIDQAFPSRR